MKTLTTYIVIFLICISCSGNIFADSRSENTADLSTTYLNPKRDPGHRPKSPAKIYLVCQYSIGHISLSFPDDATYMDVSLNDETGPVWIGTISRTNPETEIPSLLGEYTIICQTDQNQIFEGTLNFN